MKNLKGWRDDPILGVVKICRECKEEWPVDPEFYGKTGPALKGWLKAVCRACIAERLAVRRVAI